MESKKNKFLTVYNIDQLGQFDFNYAIPITTKLTPAFKLTEESEVNQYNLPIRKLVTLMPGFLDVDGVFYPCPLRFFYVQFYKILKEENKTEEIFEGHFKIFNRTLSKSRDEKLIFKRTISTSNHLDFLSYSFIVNIINEYIDSNKPLEELDLTKLKWHSLRKNDKSIVINIVNNLQIEFYSNSSSNNPGKDNMFWLEAEVRNLPKDEYLSTLIKTNLRKQCLSLNEKENFLLMRFDVEKAFLPNFERKNFEDSDREVKNIKEMLKLELAITYDGTEHLIESIRTK